MKVSTRVWPEKLEAASQNKPWRRKFPIYTNYYKMGERRDVWGVQNSAVFVRHTGKCVKCLRAADDTFVRTGAHNELEQNRGSQKERLNKRKDKQIRGQPKNSIVVRCRHAIHSVQVSWKSSQSHFFLRKSRSQLVWRQVKFQTIRRRREKLDWQGSHPIMTVPFCVYICIPGSITKTQTRQHFYFIFNI